jgi:hypothetical protein
VPASQGHGRPLRRDRCPPVQVPGEGPFTGVAASSGLAPVPGRRGRDADQHPMLGTYLAYHLPFYQWLYQRRLMA